MPCGTTFVYLGTPLVNLYLVNLSTKARGGRLRGNNLLFFQVFGLLPEFAGIFAVANFPVDVASVFVVGA